MNKVFLKPCGIQRINWQTRVVFTEVKSKGFRYKLASSTKICPVNVDLSIQKQVLKQMRALSGLLGTGIRLVGLNFFKISGQRSLFRKRKNVNLNLVAVGRVSDSRSATNIMHLFFFWKLVLDALRQKYRVHAGAKKKINKNRRCFSLYFINPILIRRFLQPQGALDLYEELKRNLLVKIIVSGENRAAITMVYNTI